MSKLSEYSKFDHLDDDDEDSSDENRVELKPESNHGVSPKTSGVTKKGSNPGRYIFECNGRKIYEWEQSLDEVNIYVEAPPGVSSASQLSCQIFPQKLQLGLSNSDRFFIDEKTFSKVNLDDSSWYLDKDEGIIHIILSKVFKGETWECVLLGKDNSADSVIDPMTKQEIQKELMLERFQEENPGFDFRGATFNGAPPDPRTFMGGVKYT